MTNRPGSKLGALDLSAFDNTKLQRRPTREEIDRTATLPSRDPPPEKEGDDQVKLLERLMDDFARR